MTRFIAYDKVVYQGVRWATRLASDNSLKQYELESAVNYLAQT